jgi:O-antigen ligase
MSLAFAGLVLFLLVYCLRPEDWIPGAAVIPFAKIAGIVAVAGFGFSALLQRRGALSLQREMVFLVLLFGWLCLAVPFSIWRSGSLNTATEFSKVVLIAILIAMIASSLGRLRRLMFVQAASVAILAAVSVWSGREAVGIYSRTYGVVGNVFDNPNDLAFNIALVIPFCLAFLLAARGLSRKAAWASALAIMGYAVLVTYSRAGLLALVTAVAGCVWEFGLKGRRYHFMALIGLAGLAFLLASPTNYRQRVRTILNPDLDPTGSSQARRELLNRSLSATAEHPLFGVGPGMFQIISGNWHVAHNTYTQLSSEAGVPALLFFVLLFWQTFRNMRRTQQLARGDVKLMLLAGALRAALVAFVVGAFFNDAGYHFYPYFLVGYASALHQIACRSAALEPESSQAIREASNSAKGENREQKSKMAWTAT